MCNIVHRYKDARAKNMLNRSIDLISCICIQLRSDVCLSVQFSGEKGERFAMECAKFCRDQKFVFEQLKFFNERETKIHHFMQVTASLFKCLLSHYSLFKSVFQYSGL